MKKMKLSAIFVLIFALGLHIAGKSYAQNRQEAPPEYKEVMAALKIEDLNAQIKELERIKAAYPTSAFKAQIDNLIVSAKIGLCTAIDSVVELQKPLIEKTQGFRRLGSYYTASMQILTHKNLKQFDKKRVTEIIRGYTAAGIKTAADPEVLKSIPAEQRKYVKVYAADMYLVEARAYLNEDNAGKSLETLDKFKKEGGEPDSIFYYTAGSAYAKLGKIKEAYEAYFEAAADNFEDSIAKAKELYQKLFGKTEGFDAKLEAKWRELPYRPEPFKPTAEWKGKTVLAEIFTGSECPPCVGADLGFDGLIESYGPKYAAVLEYHLPIPRPDPMMNPATKKRQDYYGINSTPTAVFDGDKKVGGGSRGMAQDKFKEYCGEINAKIYDTPQVALKASAARKGDVVKIDYSFDKIIPNVEYHLALVQKEEKCRGGNGIVFHKMVVREFLTIDPAAKPAQATMNLAESEKLAAAHLADYEKEKNFQFGEKHFLIDRTNLGVVFFAQDKASKKVFNAVVADVK